MKAWKAFVLAAVLLGRLQRSPYPLAGIRDPTSKGRGGVQETGLGKGGGTGIERKGWDRKWRKRRREGKRAREGEGGRRKNGKGKGKLAIPITVCFAAPLGAQPAVGCGQRTSQGEPGDCPLCSHLRPDAETIALNVPSRQPAASAAVPHRLAGIRAYNAGRVIYSMGRVSYPTDCCRCNSSVTVCSSSRRCQLRPHSELDPHHR